jgi:pimeloyl-ACP methyl ester carboxylesterase
MDAYLLSEWNAYLRYLDYPGQSPAIVYLAGLGIGATATYPYVFTNPILRQYRSIVADFLGFGYSDRPTTFGYTLKDHAASIASLLTYLDLKATTVIGHSMGGAIAIELASQFPDLVSTLILAEANLDVGGGPLSIRIAGQTETHFIDTGYQNLLEMIKRSGQTGDRGMALLFGSLQIADPCGLHRSAVSLVEGTQPVMREQLQRLNIPRLYMFGDQSLPDPDTERLPENGVDVAIIPNAGHAIMWDNPSAFAGGLASFLTKS